MPAQTSRLQHDPSEYDPFALIRLLECTDLTKPRVGRSLKPAEDLMSFGQPASAIIRNAS